MNNRDRIDYILSLIKEKAEEILEDETLELTDDELVAVATSLVLEQQLFSINYSSPIGTVDRTRVSFMIDDELEVDISPLEEDENEN